MQNPEFIVKPLTSDHFMVITSIQSIIRSHQSRVGVRSVNISVTRETCKHWNSVYTFVLPIDLSEKTRFLVWLQISSELNSFAEINTCFSFFKRQPPRDSVIIFHSNSKTNELGEILRRNILGCLSVQNKKKKRKRHSSLSTFSSSK